MKPCTYLFSDLWWLEEVPVPHCPAHRVQVVPEGGVRGHMMQGGVEWSQLQEITRGQVGANLEEYLWREVQQTN